MKLSHIVLQNYRNLQYIDLSPSESMNVVFGKNGSGKTSLLEAISYLGLGRSFRTPKYQYLINNEQEFFAIAADVLRDDSSLHDTLGICRYRNKNIAIKVNSQNTNRLMDLIDKFCVQVIHPQGVDLILEGPELRRNFIDWGIFYSQTEFKNSWLNYRKLLSQRNTLIKQKATFSMFSVWDELLAEYGEKIDNNKKKYLEDLTSILKENLRLFLPNFEFDFHYQKGWTNGLQLRTVLNSNLEKDSVLGYTFYGCHRAEIKIKCNNFLASEILSRGQLKLLVCAMRLSQGQLLKEQTGKNCVYLIDDLSSELDSNSQQLLLSLIQKLDSQVFITNINKQLELPNFKDVLYINIEDLTNS